MVGSRNLGGYRSAIKDVRLAEASHVMSKSEDQFAQAKRQIEEAKEKAAQSLKTYGSTVESTRKNPSMRPSSPPSSATTQPRLHF